MSISLPSGLPSRNAASTVNTLPLHHISFPAIHKKQHGNFSIRDDKNIFQFNQIEMPWSAVGKHQVSPISHPKHLLQLVLNNAPKPLKFEFTNREALNRVRTQITQRLKRGTKRPLSSTTKSKTSPNKTNSNNKDEQQGKVNSTPFHTLSPTTLTVTRASLLSSNPTLRAQHSLLVPDTISESDFWSSHQTLLADEAARIHGKYRPGQSSSIKSNLDLSTVRGSSGGTGGGRTRKKIKLGVEEMRQIFIMYPAVHRAYEEKVPLDWSEEQFWRKYLESEYFHRDRGRIGSKFGRMARKMGSAGNHLMDNQKKILEEEKKEAKKEEDENNKKEKDTKDGNDDDKKKVHEEDDNEGSGARVAGSEDIFSRNDAELQKQENTTTHRLKRHKFAIGQFDLASTYFTERSNVGLPDQNLYPDLYDQSNNGIHTSSNSTHSVVQKYNRHWAMVLNPEEATARTNLLKKIASNSINFVSEDDDASKAGGGRHKEMVQLVSFANCKEGEGDHAKGLGEEQCRFAELDLKNVEVYSGHLGFNQRKRNGNNSGRSKSGSDTDLAARLSKAMSNKVKNQMENTFIIPSQFTKLHNTNQNLPSVAYSDIFNHHPSSLKSLDPNVIFPRPALGKRLLSAISNFMCQGTEHSDEHVSNITAPLPMEFKQNLVSFFRRSSELLRHFFGLRRLLEEDTRESDNQRKKLVKIVQSMTTVYREMEETRKNLPQTDQGEIMKKMCMPIMDQLDYAFKLNQGSGGGFSTVWN